MTSTILHILPIPKKSVLQTIFNQYPIDLPLIELNNILAMKGVDNVKIDDVRQLESKYKIDILESFQLNLQEYYIVHLNDFIKSNFKLTPENLITLNNLKTIFDLDDKIVDNLRCMLGKDLYTEFFEKSLKNGKIGEGERKKLDDLCTTLNLPQKLTSEISLDLSRRYIISYMSQLLEKNRFSPEDETKLTKIAKELGVSLDNNYGMTRGLNYARRLWQLENLELPVVTTMELLQKNEQCYFHSGKVLWYEYRKNKGIQYLKLIDSGSLILTNKRVVFNGMKVTNIQFTAINDFIKNNDALEIRKQSGRNPTLEMEELEEFSIILSRLLQGNYKH